MIKFISWAFFVFLLFLAGFAYLIWGANADVNKTLAFGTFLAGLAFVLFASIQVIISYHNSRRQESEFAYSEVVKTTKRILDLFDSAENNSTNKFEAYTIACTLAYHQIEHIKNLIDSIKTDTEKSAWKSYEYSCVSHYVDILNAFNDFINIETQSFSNKTKIVSLYKKMEIDSRHIKDVHKFLAKENIEDFRTTNIYAYYEYAKEQEEKKKQTKP